MLIRCDIKSKVVEEEEVYWVEIYKDNNHIGSVPDDPTEFFTEKEAKQFKKLLTKEAPSCS